MCVGWQITLCDLIRQVTPRSSEMTCQVVMKSESFHMMIDLHSIFGRYVKNCLLHRNTPASQALCLSIDAFTGTPAARWKRPLGRPRKTWLQQVKKSQAYLCNVM